MVTLYFLLSHLTRQTITITTSDVVESAIAKFYERPEQMTTGGNHEFKNTAKTTPLLLYQVRVVLEMKAAPL